MAKDVNIHIKTTGEQQVKQNLKQVGTSAKNVGTDVQQGGQTAAEGMGKMQGSAQEAAGGVKGLEEQTASSKKSMLTNLKELAGGLGFAGLATAAVVAIKKIIEAIDDMKSATNEAVKDLAELQRSSADYFEAMDAYTPGERSAALNKIRSFQKHTGLSEDQAKNMLEVYKRTFGELDDSALDQWAGYQQLHGGAETLDLMRWMGGLGVDDSQRQGQLQRMISTVASKSGVRDSEIIQGITRYSAEYQGMGWSPEQTVANIGKVISGLAPQEARRALRGLVSGIQSFDESSALEMGVDPETAASSEGRFKWAQQRLAFAASRGEDVNKIAREMFGTSSNYALRLFGETPAETANALRQAMSQEAEQKERQRVAGMRNTAEGIMGKAAGKGGDFADSVSDEQIYEAALRQIGEEYLDFLKREDPATYKAITMGNIGSETEKEAAARHLVEGGTPKMGLVEFFAKGLNPAAAAIKPRSEWQDMTAQERFEAAKNAESPVINNNTFHYDSSQHYYPAVGDRQTGLRIQGGVQ